MNKIFSITPGFYEGDRHVDIIRLLTEADFTFEVSAGSGDETAWYNVDGKMNPEVHAQIVETFMIGSTFRFDRYREDRIKSFHGNIFRRSEGMKVDYRGCPSPGSRKAKAKRELTRFEVELKAKDQELRDTIVKTVNETIIELAKQENEACAKSHVQVLTKEPWDGLDEKAGVADKIAALKKAREDAVRLVDEISKARNKAALEELTQDGWVIEVEGGKKIAMEPQVINVVKKAYEENTAFKSREVHFA